MSDPVLAAAVFNAFASNVSTIPEIAGAPVTVGLQLQLQGGDDGTTCNVNHINAVFVAALNFKKRETVAVQAIILVQVLSASVTFFSFLIKFSACC